MNNLHRELAPISDAAWAQIEEEATRTLKRYLAARHVVDVPEPKGFALAAVGTGHTRPIEAPGDGVQAVQRAATLRGDEEKEGRISHQAPQLPPLDGRRRRCHRPRALEAPELPR